MWKAVSENDDAYDGIFFYAVKSTEIYCRPSCKSKLPKRDNVGFFDTSIEAQVAGFRPCKRCRSDLCDYQPIKEIAQKVKKLIDEMWNEKHILDKQLENIGISNRRIVDIFKEEYGITLTEYIANLRLEEVKFLLKTTDDAIIDIAYSVGFGGLSSFYSFFKKRVGISPMVYRRISRCDSMTNNKNSNLT